MGKYLLGIDNGNTVSKATLYDVDRNVAATSKRNTVTQYPRPGHSERSLLELWKNNVENIRELLSVSKIHTSQILGICNTGHGNGLYLLDRNGKPLKGIQSLDSRAESICREWVRKGIDKEVYPFTLQWPWASQTSALLSWIKRNELNLYENTGTVFLCKDYLNYCLTNVIASDFTDIGATNLLEIRGRRYSSEILRSFGLEDSVDRLPQLINSHEILGGVTKSAAAQTGLLEGTPVVAGMLDVDASMIGSGVFQTGEISIIAGTWSINAIVTDIPEQMPEIGMSTVFAVPDLYKSVEASATSVSNLEWFVNQFCAQEANEASISGRSVFEICDEKVEKALKMPSTIIFHPFLHGNDKNSNAKAGFHGIGGWHTRIDVLKSVYEGIAFAHKSHFEKLVLSERCVKKARLTGGGSRSLILSQLLADVLDIEIEVPQNLESGTWGAALTVGVGLGVYASYKEGMEKGMNDIKIFRPNQERTDRYKKIYKEYKRLTEKLNESR